MSTECQQRVKRYVGSEDGPADRRRNLTALRGVAFLVGQTARRDDEDDIIIRVVSGCCV